MESKKLENKVKFILGVVGGDIVVSNKIRANLECELYVKGFTAFSKKTEVVEAAGTIDDSEEIEENTEIVGSEGFRAGDYDYLLSMEIDTLTLENVQELHNKEDELSVEVGSPMSLWLKDLENLENELDVQDNMCDQVVGDCKNMKNKQKINAGRKTTKNAAKNPIKNTKKQTKN